MIPHIKGDPMTQKSKTCDPSQAPILTKKRYGVEENFVVFWMPALDARGAPYRRIIGCLCGGENARPIDIFACLLICLTVPDSYGSPHVR